MKNIVLLITLAVLYGCKSEQTNMGAAGPQSYPVVEISSVSTTTYRDYPATIEGTADVEIRPQVDGWLEKLFVDEGTYVQAGQSLFKINDQPYREQLNNAVARFNASEAAVINAQLEVDKVTPLVQNKVVSEVQLKAANAAIKWLKQTKNKREQL